MVYIRYFWQVNHQIYGHIRCIYTVLANPACSGSIGFVCRHTMYFVCMFWQRNLKWSARSYTAHVCMVLANTACMLFACFGRGILNEVHGHIQHMYVWFWPTQHVCCLHVLAEESWMKCTVIYSTCMYGFGQHSMYVVCMFWQRNPEWSARSYTAHVCMVLANTACMLFACFGRGILNEVHGHIQHMCVWFWPTLDVS